MNTLMLPFPPSTNTYYRNVGGRTLISAKGRAYRASVISAMKDLELEKEMGRLQVSIVLCAPDRRRRDLDNFGGKALLDALTHAGIWEDDSQIDDLRVIRGEIDPMKEGYVRVTYGDDLR